MTDSRQSADLVIAEFREELNELEEIEEAEVLEALEERPDAGSLDTLDTFSAFDPLESISEVDALDKGSAGEIDGALIDIADSYSNELRQTLPFFSASLFPFFSLNKNMMITSCNAASDTHFAYLGRLIGSPFFDVFGKAFQIEDIKAIRETLLRGANNYSWRGVAQIKSRDHPTMITRVYIYPGNLNIRETPAQFYVMFDDITEENKRLLRSVFMSLLEASKLKDNDTGKHITRVNYYSECLARQLRDHDGYDTVDADFIDDIGFLASMHDVGKIGTPDDILNNEGPLSDFEWTIMKEHTVNGAFILSTYPNPMAREIALNHHEKWNGQGYPYKIEGDMIPLAARIVSIADVYDALRMKRSYKPPLSHETAVQKIIEGSGTQFDPSLTGIFKTVADDFNVLYEANKD
jgi:putative two-component system response regulator